MVRMGGDSVVGRTTERTEFEPRTEEIFSDTKVSRPALGPFQPPLKWIPGFLPYRKAARA